MEPIDILGNKLKEGDYVIWSRPNGYGTLNKSKIGKITEKSVILERDEHNYWRRVTTLPKKELLKITEEQFNYRHI